jgi:GWxTD domain-containing protein
MIAVPALRFWATTPAAHSLGRALLHFLWQGAAVAAILAALLAITRSARVRYALAVGAMAALAISFGLTWTLALHHDSGATTGLHFAAPYRIPPPPDSAPAPATPQDHLAGLVPLWMAGVLLCYGRSFASWIAAQRLRRRGVCAAPGLWQERLHALASRVRISRPVLLLESCLTDTPVTFGWLRPVILLPIGLAAGLPPEQVEAILLHELAHIRRYDYAVNLLSTFVEGLLFYHPAVWWVARVIRAERENCCDDFVVVQRADTRAYAAALARLEHNRSLATEAALAASGGNLMKRIRRLLAEPERPRSATALVVSLFLLLITVAAAVAWTPTPKPQAAQPPSRTQLVQQTIANTYDGAKPDKAEKDYQDFIAFVPQTAAPQPQLQQLEQFKRHQQIAETGAVPYLKWVNEDVAYIITDEERTAFKKLQTDAEREQFIEQFWTRRDPTPGTVENEFKQEHYRRIAYANEHFSDPGGTPGWKTGRGRVYIVYGPPDELEDHSKETAKPPYQLWRYRLIEGIGKNVIIQFTDRNGSFVMDFDPAELSGPISSATVRVGMNGAVTFSVPFDLAARAYTGTWSVTRKGEDVILMLGQFDSRFGSHAVTLQPGTYKLKLILRDPNGYESTSETEFSVD